MTFYPFIAVIVVIVLIILVSSLKILREYERGVIFLFGHFQAVKGPGIIVLVPIMQQMVRIDLRTIVMTVPPQDVISRDNVPVKVDAMILYRVIDPEKAVIQVEDAREATSQLAQTTLRSVLGQHELDEMLAERDKLNHDVQMILDQHTDAWGIKVSNVEIKQVDLDDTMVRAIARQAEAERQRRAKVINAEGELQASQKLMQAAQTLMEQPQSIQLRYLQTLVEVAGISGTKTNTIAFPLPLDLLEPLLGKARARAASVPPPDPAVPPAPDAAKT
ncbi:MAG: slipin family protein [Xanthomonadaceae bacterium]|nr:slipin family protein [Xanthomonadaceae bacterium]